MEITRREALLLPALGVVRLARAQAANELSVTNSAGVTIRPFENRSMPAVSLSLPGRTNQIAAVIEMPEHAYTKLGKTDDPVWFYRMYTNDAHLKAAPQWTRDANALAYRLDTPSGFALRAQAALDKDGITIAYQLTNPAATSYAEFQAPTCIKLYHPFTDVFLERTYVHHSNGLDLLASETPERLAKNAEEWLPCRYIVRSSPDAAPPPARMERQPDGITRYYKQRAADASFLATESSPAGWVAATHSLDSPDVWTNPARTCHHADTGVALGANATAQMALKLYVMRGGSREAWNTVAERTRLHHL
jgi:hypothetical protein